MTTLINMSLALPSRRLTRAAVTLKPLLNPQTTSFPPPCLLPTLNPSLQPRRTFLRFLRGRKRGYADPIDPLSAEFLKRKPQRPTAAQQPELQRGDLAPSSIFESSDPSAKPPSQPPTDPRTPPPSAPRVPRRDPSAMAAALDPNPRARKRWLRKMTIRAIRSRGRLNKTVKILRTERSHLAKSHFLKTSVKKLGPLARQIAGKPIEDAIVQMRFSPKKAAREVKRHLEYARDEAVVRRGMGLGGVDGKGAVGGGEVVVEDKKGKRRVVRDKTEIYVDQAWVGRGSFERKPDYRARGRVNIMMCPYTSISVVLKEEATRIRLAEEREQKRQKKKVWVPLPDRPVTAQRQYCLW